MSQWDTRVRDHEIWSELELTGIAIDTALSRDDANAETIAGLERLRLVITIIGKRLASTDPLLVIPPPLATFSTSLTRIKAQLEAFSSNGNPDHIVNGNAYADEAIGALGMVPGPASADELSILSAAASDYRTIIGRYLKNAQKTQLELEDASKANAERIAKLDEALTSEQAKLSSIIVDHQTQFSTAQDRRASEFSSALSEQQSKFSNDQDARKSIFSDSQLENQEKVTALLADYSNQLKAHEANFAEHLVQAEETHLENLEELRAAYEKTAADILEQINKHKTDVESLVGVIGNLGVTSGYLKVANHARKMLYLWQALTITALAGLILVAFMVAFPTERATEVSLAGNLQLEMDKPSVVVTATNQTNDGNSSDSIFYQGFATRIFLSLTFGIFATYAARQASRFFETEQRNRRRALELEALGPFIEPLEKSSRDQFRLQVGERSFAVPDNETTRHKEDDPVTALSLIKPKEIADALANIIRASKS